MWVDNYRQRVDFAIKFVAVVFALLTIRLCHLQVVRGTYYRMVSRANASKHEWLPARRGALRDRNGVILAESRPAYSVTVDARRIAKKDFQALMSLLKTEPAEREHIWRRVELYKERNYREHLVVFAQKASVGLSQSTGNDRDMLTLVAQELYRLPGVEIVESTRRYYPNGAIDGHVVGYSNHIRHSEWQKCAHRGCQLSDLVGRQAGERFFERFLRGRAGIERFAEDAHRNRLSQSESALFISKPLYEPPSDGQDVWLTIDLELQRKVEAVFGDTPGATVVLDVKTGEILAKVSSPTLLPDGSPEPGATEQLKPYLDKTLARHYPPGSTFKFVTALAALQDNKVGPQERIVCPGFHQAGEDTFGCTSRHGSVNLDTALQKSCNVYFWNLAERVGMDRIAAVAEDFGFASPTGLGLNGDIAGSIPTKSFYEEEGGHKLGHTLNMAAGQGDVEVTVMQLAVAYAALVTGRVVMPQIISKRTHGETVVTDYRRQSQHRPLRTVSRKHLRQLDEGLYRVVNRPGGTAFTRGHSAIVDIAGKTGTAQVRGKKLAARRGLRCSEYERRYCDHAWFAGYAPAQAPEIVVVVLAENGGPGGRVAAPIAKKIFEAYFAKEETVASQ